MDRQLHRRLAGSRLPLEGRIDLHGLPGSRVGEVLHAALERWSREGVRYGLVICGHGTGVVRDICLRVLAASPRVTGYGTAGRFHGRQGAFYVALRRPSASRPR